MNINLLLVSVDEFPQKVLKHLSDYGFLCMQARGRLKVVEIFKKYPIDTVVWYLEGYEGSFAMDIVEIINEHQKPPLVILTKYYRSYPFIEEIKKQIKQVDLNDDLNDVALIIDGLCNEIPQTRRSEDKSNYYELDFKHAISDITNPENKPSPSEGPAIKFSNNFIAVDNQEKELLSSHKLSDEGNFRSKVKNLINRIV